VPETGAPEMGAPEAGDRIAVAFARVLRGLGLDVTPGSTVTFARALAAVGIARRQSVYWAGRATLVHEPDDIDRYDAAFDAYWTDDETADDVVPPEEKPVLIQLVEDADTGSDGASERDHGPLRSLRWSRAEVLRHRDFADCSPAELDETRRLMADLRFVGERRRSRRLRPARHRRAGARPDLRRTVRRALRTGGEPIERPTRAPSSRPRHLLLLCDVSGSMEPYSRALVRFMHAAVVGRSQVEAFALGTRLTRLTRELSWRDPDAALTAAGKRVHDWSGGTRLGDGLREFNNRWGVRGLARGATVVILSDGWDRGDADALAGEMERLQRVAHRIVWVNPLKASPGFAPLAAGMAAALPFVDDLVAGHSLASLESLAAVLGAGGGG